MRVGSPTVGSHVPRYPPSGTVTSTSTVRPPVLEAAMREPTCWKGTPSAVRSAAPQTRPSYRSRVANRTSPPAGSPATRSTTSS